MIAFSAASFSVVSFSVLAFALASGEAPPNLIQHPGLTSSSWTVMTPPTKRRPIEEDEALILMLM